MLCKSCGLKEVIKKTNKGRQKIYCDVCSKRSNNAYILRKREYIRNLVCQQCKLPMPEWVQKIRVFCPECAKIRQQEARVRNMIKQRGTK